MTEVKEISNLKYSEDIINEASRFLASLLRHEKPKSANIRVDSRGWVNGKDIRMAIQKYFNHDVNASNLLDDVLRYDDGERFQFITDEPIYTMIRAKYGHSIDLNLYDVDINEEECTHYEIQLRSKKAYVTAENTDIAQQIFIERHLDNMSFNPREIKIKEVDYVSLFKNDSPSYHHTQFDTTDTKMESNMMGTHQSEYTLVNQRIYHRK